LTQSTKKHVNGRQSRCPQHISELKNDSLSELKRDTVPVYTLHAGLVPNIGEISHSSCQKSSEKVKTDDHFILKDKEDIGKTNVRRTLVSPCIFVRKGCTEHPARSSYLVGGLSGTAFLGKIILGKSSHHSLLHPFDVLIVYMLAVIS
jgi:hypothetical protein